MVLEMLIGVIVILCLLGVYQSHRIATAEHRAAEECKQALLEQADRAMRHLAARNVTEVVEAEAREKELDVALEHYKDSMEKARVLEEKKLKEQPGPKMVRTVDGRVIDINDGWEIQE